MDPVEVKDLTYRYPTSEEEVLKTINLSVKKGELCAIIGANGSGKTTLCNAIRGFVPGFYKGEMKGEVWINGRNIADVEMGDLALEIGYVFQNPFTQITGVATTVYGELAYGLENMGVEPEKIHSRVEEMMKLTRIEEFRDKDPYQLSGGQQQRVALAAILVMGQDILIIDEPTSQLDPQSTDDIFEIIRLMKSMGKTIILVEHKMEQVAEYSDKVVILDNGEKIAEGTPKEIFTNRVCKDHHIRLPQCTKLAAEFRAGGIDLADLPITVEEAVDDINKYIKS